MWYKLSRNIIVYRFWLLLATIGITSFMAWKATGLELSYDFAQVVPESDEDYQYFKEFKRKYGEDGNVMVIGMQDDRVFKKPAFDDFYMLNQQLQKLEGIKEVISLVNLKRLAKDTAVGKFYLQPVFTHLPSTTREIDSLLQVAQHIHFYDQLLYNPKTHATLVAISLKKEYLNSKYRQQIVEKILAFSKSFSDKTGIHLYYAGLPYIRTIMVGKFQREFKLLLYLSMLATCLFLYFFFRTFKAVLFTVLVIGITVIWTMGLVVIFGYKVNLLTGMLPALIVILSIPNCIYMFNKYHQEFRKHGNKVKAISRMVEKTGFITFITNANTAVGFLVLLVTDVLMIREFGVIAGLMSLATFVISIVVVPSLLMYLPVPTEKQLMHLDKKLVTWLTRVTCLVVDRYRPAVYIVNGMFLVLAIYGIFRIQVVSYMVDDLPESDNVKTDLTFFEQHFHGVMPLEIVVDLGKKKAIYRIPVLKKLDELEQVLLHEPHVSPPLSIVSLVKSSTEAFYNFSPDQYRLPDNNEKNFILKYFGGKNKNLDILRSFVDSNAKEARFTLKVADLGTIKMDSLIYKSIKPKITRIFEGTGYEVRVTGTTLLFLKGNKYLFDDLSESLLIAFVLISLMMAFLFTDIRMIIISIIPNLIPMIITAGLMGILDVRMKTSTAIIFSISFGITIDSTIHFLSKFKQEMAFQGISVLEAVHRSIREACVSMLYTSIVLILGFGIFLFSEFGGTRALGMLTCITLLFAMLTNLVLLPALLVSFVKKNKKEPIPSVEAHG